MAGFTKLFGSLLASTVWRESDKVRIVWITLLAMTDQRGIAEGSIPGIADLARVSIEDCETALGRLQEPDQYSRSPEHDGRRIVPVEGGFLVLNHAKYRAKLNEDERREYKRRWAAERRGHGVDRRVHKSTMSTHTEAEADKNPPNPPFRGATRAERKRAEEIRKVRMGCQHDPRCANAEACIVAVVAELRAKAATT